MAQKTICQISQHEADLLFLHGITPKCTEHRHISRADARLLVNGTEKVPWLAKDAQQVPDQFKPMGMWARLPDGTESGRYVVLTTAREWTASQSWLPIGTERKAKHGKTRCIRREFVSQTQCQDNNFMPPPPPAPGFPHMELV